MQLFRWRRSPIASLVVRVARLLPRRARVGDALRHRGGTTGRGAPDGRRSARGARARADPIGGNSEAPHDAFSIATNNRAHYSVHSPCAGDLYQCKSQFFGWRSRWRGSRNWSVTRGARRVSKTRRFHKGRRPHATRTPRVVGIARFWTHILLFKQQSEKSGSSSRQPPVLPAVVRGESTQSDPHDHCGDRRVLRVLVSDLHATDLVHHRFRLCARLGAARSADSAGAARLLVSCVPSDHLLLYEPQLPGRFPPRVSPALQHTQRSRQSTKQRIQSEQYDSYSAAFVSYGAVSTILGVRIFCSSQQRRIQPCVKHKANAYVELRPEIVLRHRHAIGHRHLSE